MANLQHREKCTARFFVKPQLCDAGGGRPHLHNVLPLFRLFLEMGQVIAHRLKHFEGQDVAAIIDFHMHEEGAHFVGKVFVNPLMRSRGIRVG